MNIHFVGRGDRPCLVDIRPGVLERTIFHDIACFSRSSLSADVVRNLSGVNRGRHRRVPQSVYDVLDLARKIYSVHAAPALCPPGNVLNRYSKVTARRAYTC
jgi:hypothetical protein